MNHKKQFTLDRATGWYKLNRTTASHTQQEREERNRITSKPQ